MSTLLLVLAAISLLDSMSMVPLCILPLAAVLGGSRPYLAATGFLAGIFLVYAGSGLVLLIGFDALFDALGPSLSRWWNNPNAPELLLQIVAGGVMLAFGWRLAMTRQSHPPSDVPGAIPPGRTLVLGASLTLVGMPGAFPYFGAIEQILRAELGLVATGFALLFYNFVFVAPLAALLVLRLVLPARSEAIFRRVAELADRWGRHLIVGVLMFVGAVLAADGIGWFLGHPLLPVAEAASTGARP